jgi:hypothetical protein
MYQLAADSRSIDKTQLFVETCTSMVPNSDNVNLVRSATKMMRTALNSADLRPLRDFAAKISEWCDDVDDVFAAAGQSVVDEFDDLPHGKLHDVIRRVAQMERDVLAGAHAGRRDTLRTVYAG